jgi:hypothetical protein
LRADGSADEADPQSNLRDSVREARAGDAQRLLRFSKQSGEGGDKRG